MSINGSLQDFERQKFVESPSRPGQAAIEVVVVGMTSGSGLKTKNGIVEAGDFTGSPLKFDVVFSTAFTTDYSICITGVDGRSWTYESKTSSGFTINTNASSALTGEVSWQAIAVGEST